jgi:hypothetical protein
LVGDIVNVEDIMVAVTQGTQMRRKKSARDEKRLKRSGRRHVRKQKKSAKRKNESVAAVKEDIAITVVTIPTQMSGLSDARNVIPVNMDMNASVMRKNLGMKVAMLRVMATNLNTDVNRVVMEVKLATLVSRVPMATALKDIQAAGKNMVKEVVMVSRVMGDEVTNDETKTSMKRDMTRVGIDDEMKKKTSMSVDGSMEVVIVTTRVLEACSKSSKGPVSGLYAILSVLCCN